MKIKKYCLTYLGCLSLLFILCQSSDSQAAPNDLDKVSLQLKWLHQFQFAGYYAAEAKGFYREAGLDVRILEGGSNVKHDEIVLKGEANYGVMDSEIVKQRLAGKPFVVLAVIMQHSYKSIITRADSNITSLSGLRGLPVMINKNEITEFQAMFAAEGVSLDELKIQHKDKTAINKLLDGEIYALNGSLANQPYTIRKRGHQVNIFRPMDFGIDFFGDVLLQQRTKLTVTLKEPGNFNRRRSEDGFMRLQTLKKL